MIRQSIKDLYFASSRWITLPNHYLAKLRFQHPSSHEGYYLHVGCGPDYLPGMINVDVNPMRRKDVWLDVRNGLPLRDGSVYFVYCSHVLEHLYPDQALRLLREFCRVLASSGVARVAVPSIEHALKITASERESHWPRDFPDGLGQAINYLFCDGQHRYGYSASILTDFSRRAGFSRIIDYSRDHGVQPKTYGKIEVGDEPEGSLVFELHP